MAKIVSRLINNFKFVSKNLVSSGVLQLSNNAASNFNSNSNSDSDSLFSTNIIFTYKNDDRGVTEVSKLRYPIITDGDDDDDDDDLLCFKYPNRNLEICSHSHGIVCFSDGEKDIFLFNPFSRLYLRLYPPPLLPSHIMDTLENDGYFDPYHFEKGVTFCYDPESNHFKVVRFVLFHAKGNGQSIMAHVYNSITDRWTQVLSTPVTAPYPFCSWDEIVFHNGVCYWITKTNCKQFIQSFDMTREVFNPLIPISNVTTMLLRLHIWNGSIVVSSKSEHLFHIWAMDKDDDESGEVSLSNLFTFDSHSILLLPFLFVNSDELLMMVKDRVVVSYNTKTQEIKYLPIKADQVSHFENSLTSLEVGIPVCLIQYYL